MVIIFLSASFIRSMMAPSDSFDGGGRRLSDPLFPEPITDDPWLLHFHAIGVTTAIWNLLEDSVHTYVVQLSGIGKDSPLLPLLERTGNVSKADLLPKLAATQDWELEAIVGLEHFVRAFNICRENRNIMMHSRLATDGAGAFYMQKTSNTGAFLTFDSDHEVLRRVAMEMSDYLEYLPALMNAGWKRTKWGKMIAKARGVTEEQLPPLPDKPPLPRKLDPIPAPTAPQGG